MLLRTLWKGTLSFPYPVPFELLGDNAKGWLQTDYLDTNLRLSRGNKGSLFVLTPEPEPDDPELEALLELPPSPTPPPDPASLTKDPVLICPAQFGTLADYQVRVTIYRTQTLYSESIHSSFAPLFFLNRHERTHTSNNTR